MQCPRRPEKSPAVGVLLLTLALGLLLVLLAAEVQQPAKVWRISLFHVGVGQAAGAVATLGWAVAGAISIGLPGIPSLNSSKSKATATIRGG